MIQFNDTQWETEEELIQKLEALLGNEPTDNPPLNPFHEVRICETFTQAELGFREIESTFFNTKHHAEFKKFSTLVFYLGNADLRYKFTSVDPVYPYPDGTKESATKNYITREKREVGDCDYHSKITCECSMKVCVKALILIDTIKGQRPFVIRETSLKIPFEDVSYRVQSYAEDIDTYNHPELKGKTPQEMHLFWMDYSHPDMLSSKRTGYVERMTAWPYNGVNVSKDMEYSDWGFWVKINGIKD